MLQVVFVHTIYWLYSIQPTVAKSFSLFEMLVFFFVTGAVNSIKEYRSYGSFCIKRVKGLMIPYYIYAAICMAIAGSYYLKTGEFSSGLAFQMFLSWLIPVNTQIMPMWFFAWALWFVPVYLVSIVLFPLVKKNVRRFGRVSIAFLVLLFLLVEVASGLLSKHMPDGAVGTYIRLLSDIIRESSFYIIFMGAGVLYSQFKLRKTTDLLVSFAVLAVSVAGLCISSLVFGQSLDMQTNKFPPNHVFLFYSFAVMTILYLAFPLLKALYRALAKALPPIDKLFSDFSENSITVFLYQSFAFWGTYLILRRFQLRKTDFEPYAALLIVYSLAWLTIKLVNLVKAILKTIAKSLASE